MDLVAHRNHRFKQAEQLLASSLAVKERCRLNKVGESTMYRWLGECRKAHGTEKGSKKTGWIEVDRKSAKEAMALAVCGNDALQAPPPSTLPGVASGFASTPDSASTQSIRASIGRVALEIPPGCAQEDIAHVYWRSQATVSILGNASLFA